jgi:hypothetical protein
VTKDSDGFNVVRKKVTTTRTITAELRITETIEEVEKPISNETKLVQSKSIQIFILGIILDVAGNLLATTLQLGFLLQNIISYLFLNLIFASLLILVALRGCKNRKVLSEKSM